MAVDDTKLLFIVGRGRSGTSLLQTILNTHPQISVAPEAQFIMFLRRRYQNANWNESRIAAFARDLWLEERMENWHLEPEALKQQLLKHNENADFATLCKEVYYQYGLSKQKKQLKIVGDKNPHYALYLKHLIDLYPNAKFVHIVRDPRDTVLSYKAVNFDADHTATLANRWNIYNKAIVKFSKKMPGKFYFLRFEDLLTKPEKTLTQLCEFIGVEYEPEMLNFYKKEQDWEADFRKNLKNPLDPNKAYRWKKEMSQSNIQYASAITRKMATEFGYEVPEVKYAGLRRLVTVPHCLYAHWVTFLEKLIYKFPLAITAPAIAFYRKLTAPKKSD